MTLTARPRRGLELLIAVSSILVGTVGLTPSAQLRGQDATPAASPATSPIALASTFQRLVDAIAAGDGAAVAALYTEDGTYEDVPSGTIAQGRKEIAAFIEEVAAQQTDVSFRPTTAHAGAGWAVWEYSFAATDLTSGVRTEVRGATVFELEAGLIRRSADYYAPPPRGGG